MGIQSAVKITVAGLWHLGCVTSACCARRFHVIGFDEDAVTVANLNAGRAPLFEPGLDELIGSGISNGTLRFTSDVAEACAQADVLWITYDTPVNDNDEADVEFVVKRISRCVSLLPAAAVVLISSQLPVGTCRRLENQFPGFTFAYSPENLQLGKAIQAFESAARIVVGTRDGASQPVLAQVLSQFCENILWMRTESAEMVKHGLNSFLALSIAFINEIATVCEKTGADAKEVSSGLKSDARIGPRAYLSAGGAFAGGTLARDIVSLTQFGNREGLRLDVIAAVKRSNDWHRGWALRRLVEKLGDLKGRRIGLLGLTYKPGTDTLRRSSAVELAHALTPLGAVVRAFDPAVKSLEEEHVELASDALAAAEGADALVVCTEWPAFRQIDWRPVVAAMKRPLVLDANRFLEKEMMPVQIEYPQVEYLSVGRT
jgi:UDPglucose 6-dehydrogenase